MTALAIAGIAAGIFTFGVLIGFFFALLWLLDKHLEETTIDG